MRDPRPPLSSSLMPSLGTRRSTRVFLPKSKSAVTSSGVDPEEAAAGRVLRSGKRLALSKPLGKPSDGDPWLHLLAHGWHVPAPRTQGCDARPPAADPAERKMFRNVYSRKRSRPQGPKEEDRKYGIVFARKQPGKRLKVTPFLEQVVDERHEENAREAEVIEKVLGLADFATNSGYRVFLAVLIESSRGNGGFSRLLISVLRWMRVHRMRIRELAAFLSSELIASVFSRHGIHFLQVRYSDYNVVLRSSPSSCGLCKIYGSRWFTPLLSVNFSALPSYFMSLHVGILLRRQFIPVVITRYLIGLRTHPCVAGGVEENDSSVPAETGFVGAEVEVSLIPAVKRNELHNTSVTQDAVILHDSRLLRKHQRKRSSLRHSRSRHPSSTRSPTGAVHPNQITGGIHSEARVSASLSSLVEAVHVKELDVCFSDDSLSNVDDSDVSTPMSSHGKRKRSALKSPVERVKEQRSALAEVKQNIGSAHCSANILVIGSDRCWREEGAEVMLENSDSNEWCLAVKVQGMTRLLHKPQDLKPCVVNRFTHAYMWGVEQGWKLEFVDKWDWLLFKELHMECLLRNSQDVAVKIIPVPGVKEVPDYMENTTCSFVRPDAYIRMIDEVELALTKEYSFYDMDSEDEEWLRQLNSSSSNLGNTGLNYISVDIFEKIISILEKESYSNPDEMPDVDSLLEHYRDLGMRDMLVALHDYWIRKRNKKGAALVRVFQGAPLRRAQLIHKPFLRKKRSFKRQRSQAGIGKPEIFFQAGAKEDPLQRVQEAESAANRAVELAIKLRSRAQMLLANAELATYKSVMALRIADAIRVSESRDLALSIVDESGG
ncbi:uncharacterized protein [Typha angustifolia]|uniref:uncharacterized protein n=1 Tax=Typha angustifolia TaxID=59011 RepID=UPI003C2CADE5